MRGNVFYLEATASHCRDRVTVEVAPAGQSHPDGREPVLQPCDDTIPRAHMFQQPHTAARADGATHLGERIVRVRYRAQREADDRVVEYAIPERKCFRVGGHEEHGGVRSGGAGASPREHGDVHVSANDRNAGLVVPEVEPCARADLEHASTRGPNDGTAPAGEGAAFDRAHHQVVYPGEAIASREIAQPLSARPSHGGRPPDTGSCRSLLAVPSGDTTDVRRIG